MPIKNLLNCFFRDKLQKLSLAERFLFEANMLMRISNKLYEILRNQYKEYYVLLKGENNNEENDMIETNLLKFQVSDILSTNEYTLEGIANFARMPIDVIVEFVSGINTNPSLKLAARIINLHSEVRRELYKDIIKKLLNEPDIDLTKKEVK
ncbi:MAG TPA: hypothetical protein VLI69_00685 [Gammaproteobacteria bacterium]|nr:hypothetical protein [Gammaproteobacteria bacterium]